MRFQSLVYAIAALCRIVTAEVHEQGLVIESLNQVPYGWQRTRDANPSQTIKLRVALKQPALDRFEQKLYEVSTPHHSRYGKHLSREQVRELVKPSQESTDVVLNWLESSGLRQGDIEEHGEWINFRTTVDKAEAMFNTDFAIYTHDISGAKKLRTLGYSVPSDVAAHITMVQPTTRFGEPRSQKSHIVEIRDKKVTEGNRRPATLTPSKDVKEACDSNEPNPECLRALYDVGSFVADPNVKTILGVSGFLEQYAKHDALEQFMAQYAPYAPDQNFSAILINGGVNSQDDLAHDDTEANLDIQYTAAVASNVDLRYYSVGGRGPLVPDLSQPDPEEVSNEPYLEYLTFLLGLPDDELPHVLSTSYGEAEQSVPQEYVKKVCDMFAQLGARGTSVIISSGDTGPGSSCLTNDGNNSTRFNPIFPASCPFVTSVGGTTGMVPESAAAFSSGGFSDIFPRPMYQDRVVSAYLNERMTGNNLGKPHSGGRNGDDMAQFYNASGRGFPDVAAQAVGFPVMSQGLNGATGTVHSVSGTSASAPVIAGLFALLSNAKAAAAAAKGGEETGKLGFLNPLLYSDEMIAAGGLVDVVDGGSVGCTGTDLYSGLPAAEIPGAGWNATVGWDPVTGLGTPRFDQMFKLVVPAAMRGS